MKKTNLEGAASQLTVGENALFHKLFHHSLKGRNKS